MADALIKCLHRMSEKEFGLLTRSMPNKPPCRLGTATERALPKCAHPQHPLPQKEGTQVCCQRLEPTQEHRQTVNGRNSHKASSSNVKKCLVWLLTRSAPNKLHRRLGTTNEGPETFVHSTNIPANREKVGTLCLVKDWRAKK